MCAMSVRAVRAGRCGKLSLLLGASLAAAAGCATARDVVVEHRKGGVVAVPDNRAAQRGKAAELMSANCAGPFEITREEEVAVGSRVSGERTTSRDLSNDLTTREEYSVKTRYEWRIHYRCR